MRPGARTGPTVPQGAVRILSVGTDHACALEVRVELEVLASGLVRVRAAVRNLGSEPYEVRHLEPALPVPAEAGELLDMTGRHTRERTPQRRPFDLGHWVRESWGGRPGHDSATLLCAGRPGFGFREGRVWGVHLACSGNQVVSAEHSPTGWRLLRGGELLLPGEVRLDPGGRVRLALAARLVGRGPRRALRPVPPGPACPPDAPVAARDPCCSTRGRPSTSTTIPTSWSPSPRAPRRSASSASCSTTGGSCGRRHDWAGLGDWYVDEAVWPGGLHRWSTGCTTLGMEFGLWFEPEMVNLDSDLAREHPDWLLGTEHGPGPASRHQHVLDLANPDAYAHVLERMSSLVDEYGIAYLKWDHNRPLVDAGHAPAGTARGPRPDRGDLPAAWTSSRPGTPGWRSSPAPPAAPAWTSASWSTPTGCGSRTASTPTSASAWCAGPG